MRETEEVVRRFLEPARRSRTRRPTSRRRPQADAGMAEVEEILSEQLATRVPIQMGAKRGRGRSSSSARPTTSSGSCRRSSARARASRPTDRPLRSARSRRPDWMTASHNWASAMPAAAAAIGSRHVSVMPGETFTSSTQGRPSASTIMSTRVTSRRRKRLPRVHRGLPARRRDLVAQPRRREVVGGARGVARGVVVDAALRHDLDGRQRLAGRARPARRRPRCPSIAASITTAPLNDSAAITAAGRSASRSTVADAERRPAPRGLDDARQADALRRPCERGAGAEVAQGASPRSAPTRASRTPARASASFASTLSKAISQSNAAVPVYGMPSRSSSRCTVPSSPSLPCNVSQHRSGRALLQRLDQRRLGRVEQPRVVAEVLAGRRSHDGPRAARRRARGSGRPRAPRCSSDAGSGTAACSSSSRLPSRAMPSRMRSSVG